MALEHFGTKAEISATKEIDEATGELSPKFHNGAARDSELQKEATSVNNDVTATGELSPKSQDEGTDSKE